MKWRKARLNEVADLCLGKMLDQNKNKGELLPYLANINVRWGEFDFTDLREMRFESHEMDRYGLKYGDIVMCEGGEPGRCSLWKEQRPGTLIQKALHRIRPNKALDCRFLYYCFLQKGRTGEFSQLFTGATIKHLPAQNLAKVDIEFPELRAQQAIADVLSTYDDLIENNRRRIQLLEESARLLYKEWFVHLRFPGHEHAKLTAGVPQGWKKKTLRDVSERVDYGYTASAQSENIGAKFLRITDIVPDVIDWSSVPYCPASERDLAKFQLREGDVVIARTGATVGYAKRIGSISEPAVFASYLVRFRFKSELDNMLGGVFVESSDYKAYVRNNCGGAAQPNANAQVLGGAEILIPPAILQREFREMIESSFRQRDVLQKQNLALARARDLLLPRLMSGEITA